jgi:hypothetical protein
MLSGLLPYQHTMFIRVSINYLCVVTCTREGKSLILDHTTRLIGSGVYHVLVKCIFKCLDSRGIRSSYLCTFNLSLT